MEYERDYGTNILIVNKNKDKNINYNIVVKPYYIFDKEHNNFFPLFINRFLIKNLHMKKIE